MRPLPLYLLLQRRRQRKQHRLSSPSRKTGQLGLSLGLVALFLAAALLVVGAFLYVDLVRDLPSLARFEGIFDQSGGSFYQPTRLYDRSGTQVIYTLQPAGVTREYLSLNPAMPRHFPEYLPRVILAAVQPDYWQSPGVDWARLTEDEAHTIAERLVSDWLLWQEPPGLRRALRLRLLAAQLVNDYGREQVLEWYLNSAYFGNLVYGADSAAQLYFGKSAAQLSLGEAVALAAVLQAPALNPLDAPAAAAQRQRELLETLLGQGVLNPEEYVQARDAALQFAPPPAEQALPARAYSQLALEALYRAYGRARVERGGLEVVTTLDLDLQQQLACAAHAQLARMQGQPAALDGCPAALRLPALPAGLSAYPADLSVSAVLVDPRSGELLAYLGDLTLPGGEASLAQPRQPGSILTPFIALAGFARASSPASLVWDIPSSLPDSLQAYQNPDGKFHGPLRLRMALGNDYLVPLAQMLQQIGPPTVWKLAELLGLGSLAEAAQPEGLIFSGGEVSLIQLAQAYTPFATQGLRTGWRAATDSSLEPLLLLGVSDSEGQPWPLPGAAEVQAALSPQLAYLVHHVLSDASTRWESLGLANPLELGRPSGAKLGQTADGRQVWTVGYTPQRLAVTSFSLPAAADSPRLNLKAGAGLWYALMQYAAQDLPSEDWSAPADIVTLEVCDPSGLLPTPDCARVVREVFLTANQPISYDDMYRVVEINRETGRLATVFTPLAVIERRIYLVVPPEAQSWASSAGLPIPPTQYDLIQPSQALEDVRITAPASFSYVSGKLEITGSAAGEGFQSYRLQAGLGINPRTWVQIGGEQSQAVQDGRLAEWDTRGLEGLYAVRLLVLRQDSRVDMAVVQVTVDNTPPQARIIYPLPRSSVQPVQGRVIFQAEAGDQIGIRAVAWYLDGKLLGQLSQEPFIFSWAAQPGAHRLQVKAIDLAGNFTLSPEISFTIEP